MRAYQPHDLLLPPDVVANAASPYEARIDAARRFLAARGITEVRPVYGHRAVTGRARARLARLDTAAAANDATAPATRDAYDCTAA